jgi:hypothetical protein
MASKSGLCKTLAAINMWGKQNPEQNLVQQIFDSMHPEEGFLSHSYV